MFLLSLMPSAVSADSIDEIMRGSGMVDVSSVAPDIQVGLMYAGADNFVGKKMYHGVTTAWLHPIAAEAVAKAQRELSDLMPGARLLIKDAARPMRVQRAMFDAVKGTPKAKYVANPARGGGLHNYGMAVDITIVDSDGHEVDMGTPVDHLGTEANIDREVDLVKRGVMSENARQNRLLLRRVMKNSGFSTIRTEWWHFNRIPLSEAREKYVLIK